MKSLHLLVTIVTLATLISTGLGNKEEEMDLGNLLQMGKYFLLIYYLLSFCFSPRYAVWKTVSW